VWTAKERRKVGIGGYDSGSAKVAGGEVARVAKVRIISDDQERTSGFQKAL
jgi:hypothetical protein